MIANGLTKTKMAQTAILNSLQALRKAPDPPEWSEVERKYIQGYIDGFIKKTELEWGWSE